MPCWTKVGSRSPFPLAARLFILYLSRAHRNMVSASPPLNFSRLCTVHCETVPPGWGGAIWPQKSHKLCSFSGGESDQRLFHFERCFKALILETTNVLIFALFGQQREKGLGWKLEVAEMILWFATGPFLARNTLVSHHAWWSCKTKQLYKEINFAWEVDKKP